MKKNLWVVMVLFSISLNAHARRGDHDGPGHEDGNRPIQCEDMNTGAKGTGALSTPVFDLTTKARGDDVGEMLLVDKRSGDTVKAKRLEELLKVTLASQMVELPTHRGYAEAVVTDPASGDSVKVESLSRRSESRMELVFTTSENPSAPIHVVCRSM